MSVNSFFDTNILVYSYSNSEPVKQLIARNLISNANTFISTQVLQELANNITRKFKVSFADVVKALNECCQNFNLFTNSTITILYACQIADQYQFSFYDSLVIAVA